MVGRFSTRLPSWPAAPTSLARRGGSHPLTLAAGMQRFAAAPAACKAFSRVSRSPIAASVQQEDGDRRHRRVAGHAQAPASVPPGATTAGPQPFGAGYWELLSSPDSEVVASRAPSATDAASLRRKGHLKEQDKLIDFMLKMHDTHTCEEVMLKMERWMLEHRQDPGSSRLRRLVPTVGSFFCQLRLVDAFREYDQFFALSRRRHVPPNFAEIRHILNIAQVHSSADTLRLITFDADGTLYADGAAIERNNAMIGHIINLMRSNVHVAIVTAAGYPGDAGKFSKRVAGLLDAFKRLNLPVDITNRFHVMGGECNYLLRVNPSAGYQLEFVADELWKTGEMLSWQEGDMTRLLDEAQALLAETAARLQLPVQVIRKPRAVGAVPLEPTIYEVLEEMAITLKVQLRPTLPFCAFNGGNDVFVDVGNKSLGLEALMSYLGCRPNEVLHVGDRFTESGNDSATRDCCSILWVANPEETCFFIKMLLKDIRQLRAQPYIE